ncbi:hypothetical protein P5673_020267 [Acropora cervicornis]|uniref:Uncharacterized protein n=1 Tax=Acropora cervicornis TaxID=6130 RepID=A0AAD9QA79_ACRCE|nr:hypothetical protein P5673_020267 [Acropora cervicornis]
MGEFLTDITALLCQFLLGRRFDPKYFQNGRSIQLTEPGGKPKIYRDGSLLTKSDKQWNGTIFNVSFFLQEEINKPIEKLLGLRSRIPFPNCNF